MKVAHPPAKPLLLYDGDCKFCTLWIHRWQLATGDFVECLPFQDPRGAVQFPEISRPQFDAAIQLILPDGSIFSAAEAVVRSLACNPEEQWLRELYEHSPALAASLETAYRFVARHRKLFSTVTWLLWGEHLEPARQNLVRGIFLRGLAVVYLAAFVSLWMQMSKLAGSHGAAPVAQTMAAAKANCDAQGAGLNRYHLLPTLCWFNTSDAFLNLQCAGGTMLAGLLVCGIAPAPCLFLLWLVYLSLTTVGLGQPGWQWANLLLETGFIAILFAPLRLMPRALASETPPSRIALWLLRWLLFRLLVESGCGQLLSSNGVWPENFSGAVSLGIKLILPWAIFFPHRPRQCAGLVFIAWQLMSLPAGGHLLSHVLILLLSLTLFDDAALQNILPESIWPQRGPAQPYAPAGRRWPQPVLWLVVLLVGCAGYAHLFLCVGIYMPGPEPVMMVARWLEPLRSVNYYRLTP